MELSVTQAVFIIAGIISLVVIVFIAVYFNGGNAINFAQLFGRLPNP